MTPGDLMRAYGCPPQMALHMHQCMRGRRASRFYRGIFNLGPMRAHYFRDKGWCLDNRPVPKWNFIREAS